MKTHCKDFSFYYKTIYDIYYAIYKLEQGGVGWLCSRKRRAFILINQAVIFKTCET